VAVAARTETPSGRLAGSIGEVVAEIRAAGGTAIAVACDVSDSESCRRLVELTGSEFGPADILVNNAALTVPEPRRPGAPRGPSRSARETLSVLNFPVDAYRRAFEVNLFGAYALTQLVLRDLVGRAPGNVVNISSDAAHVPGPGPYADAPGVPLHAYATSKAALEHLTRTVGYEVARHGIAVNAVLPSRPIATPGATFAAGGRLGPTLEMDRFVDAVERVCSVTSAELTGAVVYSEDVLDPAGRARGWLGDRYL